jgi:hypothetical protein
VECLSSYLLLLKHLNPRWRLSVVTTCFFFFFSLPLAALLLFCFFRAVETNVESTVWSRTANEKKFWENGGLFQY